LRPALATALQRRLFGPLGMRHTGFEIGPGEPLATAFADDAAWHASVAPLGRRQAGAAWMDSGGGGLRLVRPKDEGVFNGARDLNGLPVVSDIQLYLDLQRVGLRGDEGAEELRTAPDFTGGWA
jgi:CubicO group peptidase (beta-lactamase class C family)